MDSVSGGPTLDDGALAPVIQLTDAARSRGAGAGTPSIPEGAVGRDGALLGRLYGDRWHELPPDLGRVAAGLERLLEQGPMAIDPTQAQPGEVLSKAWVAVRAASVHAAVVEEEAEVLGEALGVALARLPLDQLGRAAGAVLALGAASGTEPGWADPAHLDAARLVLDAHGADLRDAAALHLQIYERFTERVWEIRESRLRAGARRRGVLSRRMLRSDFAAASRTDVKKGSVRSVADLILQARAARQRLADLTPMLERHLGRQWRGPLTDIVPIVRSQDGVRQMHRALGEQVDVERLAGLLVADAFATDELTHAATLIAQSLQTWEEELAALCTGDPWALPAGQLASWAADTGTALAQMATVLVAMSDHRGDPVPLRDVVDVLLLREHAEEQAGGYPLERDEESSEAPETSSAPQSKNASSL
ncbi:MAG: hypothetical protein WD691_09135 [Acidimicrobiales bacterium]